MATTLEVIWLSDENKWIDSIGRWFNMTNTNVGKSIRTLRTAIDANDFCSSLNVLSARSACQSWSLHKHYYVFCNDAVHGTDAIAKAHEVVLGIGGSGALPPEQAMTSTLWQLSALGPS